MPNPEEWSVGAIRTDGSAATIEAGGGLAPATVDRVVFPVAHSPNDVDVRTAPIRLVDSRERREGSVTYYRAHVDGTTPADRYWEMSLNCLVSDGPLVLRLTHSATVDVADWPAEELDERLPVRGRRHQD
ncbi:hypothetical protein [Haloplanus pelagicus]|jgi:hypothetical protein|uniref:hypothetical protein n=1 Tax=Haloplanus pelagicus TaxID=2949995 RepID=UPI00203FAFAB|nr:hypothetical protein [Haloplanus sp. HW8-1]